MLKTDQEIYRRLKDAFGDDKTATITIVDESHKHVGHLGNTGTGHTHYFIHIRAKIFADKSRLERQRLVINLLDDLFEQTDLHAVRMKLTP